MDNMPVLFVSHESPYLWDTESSSRQFLKELGPRLPRPKVIVIFSAHWQEPEFSVSNAATPATIYDFGGFPKHYYGIQYDAPGSPEIASRINQLAKRQGFSVHKKDRGFDHAVWIPVGLMFPDANIPIVSVSLKLRASSLEHYRFGQTFSQLREEGALIIGSGTATHNLRHFFSDSCPALTAEPDSHAKAFSEWLKDKINDPIALVNYRQSAPYADITHPTAEHFLPLIMAQGAATGSTAKCIHDSFNYGHFAMTSFIWQGKRGSGTFF